MIARRLRRMIARRLRRMIARPAQLATRRLRAGAAQRQQAAAAMLRFPWTNETAVLTGSCLCSGIAYEISGPLSQALNCHCSMCRKAQGSAFRTRARVLAADFRFIRGEELLTTYESSPGNHRGFCRVCGSPIHTRFDDAPDVLGLPLGALDQDPGVRPAFHVFVGSKAPWHEITDDLPQFPERPA